MPELKDDTKILQGRLAKFCRDGLEVELEGTQAGRLHHYRRLVSNVIFDALETAYPLTKKLLPPKKWTQLCNNFFEENDCSAYQVWRMPEEFYHYAQKQDKVDLSKYPFIDDLLKLEWSEVEYYCMPDRAMPSPDDSRLQLNPEHGILNFEWPVHRINALHIGHDKKGNYFALILREPKEKKVHFFDLSIAHVAFLELLDANVGNLQKTYLDLNLQLGIQDPNFLEENLKDFLTNMKAVGLLI